MSSIFTTLCDRKLSPERISEIAIGRFDGVHLGHKELISHLSDTGAVLIIDTHQSPCLTPLEYRMSLIDKAVYVLDIGYIKDFSGEEFVRILEREFSALKRLIVGYDFRFGKDRACGVSELASFFNGDTVIIPEFKKDNLSVHSALIRSLLSSGDVAEVARLLGREYEVCGDVIKGQGLGSKKLVSTINLSTKEYVLPHAGVYAARVFMDKEWINAVCFIGHRLSADNEFAFEVHMIDKEIKTAPKSLKLRFVKRLRDNFKFNDLSQLKAQILSDIKIAKEVL